MAALVFTADPVPNIQNARQRILDDIALEVAIFKAISARIALSTARATVGEKPAIGGRPNRSQERDPRVDQSDKREVVEVKIFLAVKLDIGD